MSFFAPSHLMLASLLFVATACGVEKKEQYTAFAVTKQVDLTSAESLLVHSGCTKLVTNLGTFSTGDDCKAHLANITQDPAKQYECDKEKQSPSCI